MHWKSQELIGSATFPCFEKIRKQGMLLAEYNEVKTMELFREEGRQEGREEGLISSIKKMMKNLQFTAQQAMDTLDIQGNDRQRYLSML